MLKITFEGGFIKVFTSYFVERLQMQEMDKLIKDMKRMPDDAGWQMVVEKVTDDLYSYIADHKAYLEDCDTEDDAYHEACIASYMDVLKDMKFLVHEYLPKEIVK